MKLNQNNYIFITSDLNGCLDAVNSFHIEELRKSNYIRFLVPVDFKQLVTVQRSFLAYSKYDLNKGILDNTLHKEDPWQFMVYPHVL